jgi:hypothetical protein
MSDQAKETSVREALVRRCRAVVNGDVGYLSGILAPEFRHIHATGKIEPRDVYLASIGSGKTRFTAVEPRGLGIGVYSSAALVAGDIYIERNVDGAPVGRTSRFSSVWSESGDDWRLVYWQMTAIQS